MSAEKVKLIEIQERVDQNLSGSLMSIDSKKQNFRIFTTKNSRPIDSASELDKEAVSSYRSIITGIKKVGNAVTNIFQNSNKVATTSLGNARKPIKNTKDSIQHHKSTQPLRSNFPLSNNTTASNALVNRCKKCNCAMNVSAGNDCPYCNKQQDIEVIDSDSEEFPSIEHCIRKPTSIMSNGQISTSNFYSKENSSISNHSISKSNISLTEDDLEKSVKYEVDYLFIGTYRFISRTYIRVSSEYISLFISSGRDGLQIDYKLIIELNVCEPKTQTPRHIYMRIKFTQEAVEAINHYIINKGEKGSFKFDSINGHEKYFLMKLKHLNEDDSSKLKMRLKIQLPNRCKENPEIFHLFEEQRHYNFSFRNRKKQKISDTRNNTKIQDQTNFDQLKTVNHSNDEPMEIDQISQSNTPSLTTTSSDQAQDAIVRFSNRITRSSNYSPSLSKQKYSSTLDSRNSINYVDQDDDIEISEIAKPKFNLPIKNIKNNKILFETITGETLVILKTDLSCLNDGNFLNDKIIEFYLMFIKSKLIDKSVAEKTYIFSSFFFTKMLSLTKGSLSEEQFSENLYNLVKNWTKNIDIFAYDYLIVPVFRSYHWSLAIICYPGRLLKDDFEIILDCDDAEKPAIIFMDSMGKTRIIYKYSKYLRNFLQKECLNKKDKSIIIRNQEMTILDTDVPCQLNGYDCGIFVLHYVELFLKDPKSVIQKIREKKKSLENWFSPDELKEKRLEIFKILFDIYEENVKNNLKFESDEDLTLNKSDEEIEILTNDDANKELLSDDEEAMQ